MGTREEVVDGTEAKFRKTMLSAVMNRILEPGNESPTGLSPETERELRTLYLKELKSTMESLFHQRFEKKWAKLLFNTAWKHITKFVRSGKSLRGVDPAPGKKGGDFFAWAREGKFEGIEEAVHSRDDLTFEEQTRLLYQWSLVMQDFGHAAPDANPELLLEEDGGETMLDARFEVGYWYLLGKEGVRVDADKAFLHLGQVEQAGIRKSLDLERELDSVRSQLKGSLLVRFNALFPPQ
jgi:hypothetical protein